MSHPIQDSYVTETGIYRFRENKIVKILLETSNLDLNDLSRLDFSNEDKEQFAQLIGYSLGGFSELDYISNDTYKVAENMCIKGITEQEAELIYLREQLNIIRKSLRVVIPELFSIHPDDLEY